MRPTRACLSVLLIFGLLFLGSRSSAAPEDFPPPPPDPNLLHTIQGSSSSFGFGVANVGDVNGDGFEDLLVSTTYSAFLYLGGPSGDGTPDLELRDPGRFPLSGFGASLSGGGDLNGDGYSDFVLGDPMLYPGSNSDEGACYVYLGGQTLDGHPDFTLHDFDVPLQSRWWEFFAASVSLQSDIDHDGRADLVFGKTSSLSTSVSNRSRADIHFGAATLGNTPDLILGPPQPSGAVRGTFGSHVSAAGDVNGDGIDDIMISEHGVGVPPCPAGHGRVSLFLGGAPFDTIPDQFLAFAPLAIPILRQPISSAGDFNGDGFGDVIVGAPLIEKGLSSGRAYVYFGSASLPSYPAPSLVLDQPGADDEPQDSTFGEYVFGGKDVSGDGLPDVMIATTHNVFVYFGGSSPDAVPDLTLRYEALPNWGGTMLAAWDWNGDGVRDVVVGSAGWPGGGRALIFDASTPLAGRAFVRGGDHRPISLIQPGGVTLHVQPVNGSYESFDVDPSTLRLTYEPFFGYVEEIAPVAGKTIVEGDSDHDGVRELLVSFSTEDLTRLFSSIHGRQEVAVTIEGRLLSHRRVRAPATLTILRPDASGPYKTRLSPNPLNPQGTIEFTMSAPGPVSLRLYDISGRCVRNVLRGESYDQGMHRVPIVARDDRGAALASGVYFYRLELPSGVQRGRFVVAK
jgi:FG-GAP repeat protein